ncbi:MAG: VTT domain-containing protein, partial [bacterium]
MFYTIVCTAASVLGAAFGYFIGIKGGRPVLHRMFDRKKVDSVEHLLQKYDAWAIFIAGFTPIPYKVFTIAGGVCRIHFWRFIFVSIVARGTRYAIIASLVYHLSKQMNLDDVLTFFRQTRFDLWTLAAVAVVVIAYVIYRLSVGKRRAVVV